MPKTRWWLSTALFLALAASVGCSSSNDDDASGAADAADAADEGASGAEAGDGATAADDVLLSAGEPLQDGRSIIATAAVTIEVDDTRAASTAAVDVVIATGGFLAQQEARPSDGTVSLTLRVPTSEFPGALERLEVLGEVVEQRLDTEDVTEQVVDLEGRIASARVSVERVRELLGGSGDIVQLASVEGELARREGDLEVLLGRQRVLNDQVALATIRVELRESGAADEVTAELPGFFGGLRRGWDGFVTSASVVVTALGYSLPFLTVMAVGGLGWLRLRRHRRPRPAA